MEPAELAELTPTQYHADAVVVLLTETGAPKLAVVVEAQLNRDIHKKWRWPIYLASVRQRLRCPTVLLVVCVSAAIASWCARPIDLGHARFVLYPIVLGPTQVPQITDAEQARAAPELAVLSALAHGSRDGGDKVLLALAEALSVIDKEQLTRYSDAVLAALPEAARSYLEGLMGSTMYEYQSDFVRKYVFQGRAEGRSEGEATALLTVLAARGVPVSDDARLRITTCTDVEQLDRWVSRAVTADTVDDLFD